MPERFYEIFRAGEYPQGTFTEEDIAAIADNYDPDWLEAPIALDHTFGGPAFGWVGELRAEGDRLLASFKDIVDEVKEAVSTKKYKRHSVEIFRDLEGKGPYLKAVALLGVETPQVKGLEPITFSEELSSAETDQIEFDEQLSGDKQDPPLSGGDPPQFSDQTEAELSRLRAQNRRLQRQLDKRSGEVTQFRQQAETQAFAQRQGEFASFLDKQIGEEFRLAPKMREDAIALFADLDAVSDPDDEDSPAARFRAFIEGLPSNEELFSTPPEGEEDTGMNAGQLADRARKYRNKLAKDGRIISFSQAVNDVQNNLDQ